MTSYLHTMYVIYVYPYLPIFTLSIPVTLIAFFHICRVLQSASVQSARRRWKSLRSSGDRRWASSWSARKASDRSDKGHATRSGSNGTGQRKRPAQLLMGGIEVMVRKEVGRGQRWVCILTGDPNSFLDTSGERGRRKPLDA